MNDEAEEFDDDFEPWTEDGASRLTQAATALQEAVGAHAAALVAADGNVLEVFQASETLLPALRDYAEAQFEFTGTGSPFEVLELGDEDDEDDDEPEEPWPNSGISIVQRRDFVVADIEAILAAGRTAYLRVWPDDTEADAAFDVSHLGRALYQLAHAGGWDSLDDVEGLDPIAGIVAVVKQDEPLGPDPDEWAGDLLDEDADVLYSQADVFHT